MSLCKFINIPISLPLLNCLRTFSHDTHVFTQEFISSFQKAFSECCKNLSNFNLFTDCNVEKVILGIHYYLALISNINHLIEALKIEYEVNDLNIEAINSTNIFNVKSLYKTLQFQQKDPSQENKGELKDINQSIPCNGNGIPGFINSMEGLPFKLTHEETKGENSCLFISIDQVIFFLHYYFEDMLSNKIT